MSDCGDLPPIPPERRSEWNAAIRDFLGIQEKGQVVYSPKMAKRIVLVILAKVKKDPATVRRIAGSLRGVPELDKLVAQELQTYKVGAST